MLDPEEKARFRWMPEYLTSENKDLIKRTIIEHFTETQKPDKEIDLESLLEEVGSTAAYSSA